MSTDLGLNTEIAGQPDGFPCVPSLLLMPFKVLLGEQLVPALLTADMVFPGVLRISMICDEVPILLTIVGVLCQDVFFFRVGMALIFPR